jgi:ABC-type Na+ efflux pump permease subunit
MNVVKAIFIKQLNDFPKNISVSMMFFMFPVLSFLLRIFMGDDDPMMADAMNVQFAMMFVAMGPMIMIANTIAEDNEYKSLRFLVTAGVKPIQYLGGLIFFALILSAVSLVAFALIGGLSGQDLLMFVLLCIMGCVASSILGATIGLFSKNVQQCSSIYTPIMFVLAFVPFLAQFSELVESIGVVAFTYQIYMALAHMVTGGYTRSEFFNETGETTVVYSEIFPVFISTPASIAIVGANALVFAILFAIAYKKKGLKG